VRILAGEAKGRRLNKPRAPSVRPTTGIVKKAVFSLLGSRVDNARFLDLYAGSGAMGIEALSLGARWADFVDRSPECCATIRYNLRETGFEEGAGIYCLDVTKFLSYCEIKYDIIFLDPPYRDPHIDTILNLLTSSDTIDEKSTIVVEYSSPLASEYGNLKKVKDRRYGDTVVTLYRKGGKRFALFTREALTLQLMAI
jgi:16S rRNA (guanine(966)-N(2))-methyltransferase RsmD